MAVLESQMEEPKSSTWTRARVQSRPPEPRSVLSVCVTFSVGMERFHGADRMFDGREVREAELKYPRPKKSESGAAGAAAATDFFFLYQIFFTPARFINQIY